MSVASWFGDRLPVSGRQFQELTNEPVPYHLKRWWFALGGTPAYLFIVQIITGILLAFYYEASPSTAYASVEHITSDVSFGWYIRSVHKWAATLMIVSVILHQMRVFFTGAYRDPREINWVVGMCLLLCTLLTGFTGYSLVYEQLSFWGATVGANISDTVPVVGGFFKRMMLGGDAYNQSTLSRFFVLLGHEGAHVCSHVHDRFCKRSATLGPYSCIYSAAHQNATANQFKIGFNIGGLRIHVVFTKFQSRLETLPWNRTVQ